MAKGSTLIAVLWTLSILSLLALGAGYCAWFEIRLTSYQLDRIRERRLVLAAVEVAKKVLPADISKPMSLKDAWSNNESLFKTISLDEGTCSVVYEHMGEDGEPVTFYGLEDEGDRLNLNSAGNDALNRLIGPGASGLVSHMIEWRTPEQANEKSSSDFYMNLPNPYPCKHAAYQSLEELFLVRGFSAPVYDHIKSKLTVYTPRVNINTASPDILTAIGFSPSLAREIVDYRRGLDGIEGSPDDAVFKSRESISQNLPHLTSEEMGEISAASSYISVSSRAVRLHVQVWPGQTFESGRRPDKYEVVLEFQAGGTWIIKHLSPV